MSFHYKGSTDYKCNLVCEKCEGMTKTGERCKRITCKFLPMCYQHTKSVYGVEVKKSGIEDAGFGLFACKSFRKDEIICPYRGEILTKKEIDDRYGVSSEDYSPYAIQMSSDKFMDCGCRRGIGAYSNCKNNKNNAKLAV